MKRCCFLLITSFLFLTGIAQSRNGQVSGSIRDINQKPIIAATVSLLNAKDSSVHKLAVSDKQGDFEFDRIADGKYLVAITSTGFAKAISPVFELSSVNNRVNLGNFELTVQSTELGVVTVAAKRPLIENKIDRTVVNVESSITNTGGTAIDVLEKSPGIIVDNDGNISLKGKAGVIILIDGKQTYLAGQDLVNYLRSLTAAQLDQIEIMSQPPAKFDASGNSGVINIKTKKGTQRGYNGSISLSYIQGNYPKTPNSITMNYRTGKLNLFSQYSYTYWEGFNKIRLERYFGKVDDKIFESLVDQSSFIRFHSNTHSFRVGADYYATKNTTYGISLNGTLNRSRSLAETESELLDNDYELISKSQASTVNEGPWKNFGMNFNFRSVLDKKGKELSGDLDGVYYKNSSDQISDNYNRYPDGTLVPSADPVLNPNPFLLRGHLPGEIHVYTAKLDYAQPLKKGAKFEAGVKVSYVKNDNDAQYMYYRNNVLVYDSSRSNHFIYQENINAAYLNYSRQINTRWGVQLGLRMENTNIKGNQVIKNSRFDSSYFQLFPTAYISYALDKTNNFTLSFGRRIDRPNYQDMNPFQFFLDQYTYRQGNPYLRPQTSNNIELSYNYKGQLNVSVNYTQTKDIISDIFKQNDVTRVTFQTKENVSKRTNAGLSINYNRPLTKWWTISAFGNVFNNHFEGQVNDTSLSVDAATYLISINNQFRFNKGWGIEASGFYRSKVLASGLIVGEPMGVVSFGFSKAVLKNKGSIRVNLNDPFWLQYFRGNANFKNIDTRIVNYWDNRRFVLSFTWRFSKGETQPQVRRRSAASQDEQNRIGASTGQQ